jgi:hypothetical protein
MKAMTDKSLCSQMETVFFDQLRPGARVVSNAFTFPGLYKVRQDGDAGLYLFYPERN